MKINKVINNEIKRTCIVRNSREIRAGIGSTETKTISKTGSSTRTTIKSTINNTTITRNTAIGTITKISTTGTTITNSTTKGTETTTKTITGMVSRAPRTETDKVLRSFITKNTNKSCPELNRKE
jgi:hypothetical protein